MLCSVPQGNKGTGLSQEGVPHPGAVDMGMAHLDISFFPSDSATGSHIYLSVGCLELGSRLAVEQAHMA